jgi:hypothetical protein
MSQIQTFLDRSAEAENFFLFYGDRLFSIDGKSNSQNRVIVPGNYSMGLVASLPFSDFERLDEKVNATALEEDSRAYVKERLNEEISSKGKLSQQKRRLKTLDFIVYQFLPLLYSRNYQTESHIADMLMSGEDGGDSLGLVERARNELQARLDKEFGVEVAAENPGEIFRKNILREEKSKMKTGSLVEVRYSPKDLGLKGKDIAPSITGEITGLQPFYFLNGQAYTLETANHAKSEEMSFVINDKFFVSKPSNLKLTDIKSELLDRALQRARISTLEKSTEGFDLVKEVIQATEKRQVQIAQLSKLEEYDLGNCGFIFKNDTYHVYATTPKFATQDGRNPKIFWPFPPVKVAIYIGSNDKDNPYSFNRPLVIDQMANHPCLRDRTRGYCEICNLNRDPSSYSNTPADMLRKLSDAVNVIMHPLNRESLDAHVGESYFGTTLNEILKQKPMTRDQAIAEGYFVAEVIENSARKELGGQDESN